MDEYVHPFVFCYTPKMQYQMKEKNTDIYD